jgi:hypothetical protein
MKSMDKPKPAESLDIADLQLHPVWMFVGSDVAGETVVRPVKRLPVANVSGKLIGTKVRLANEKEVWALLGNLKPNNPRMTEHFLTISIYRDNRWFHLGRYFDVDYEARGPLALAEFLALRIDDVFPIAYDVRRLAKGDPAALAATIWKEPRERLTRDELMDLSFAELSRER